MDCARPTPLAARAPLLGPAANCDPNRPRPPLLLLPETGRRSDAHNGRTDPMSIRADARISAALCSAYRAANKTQKEPFERRATLIPHKIRSGRVPNFDESPRIKAARGRHAPLLFDSSNSRGKGRKKRATERASSGEPIALDAVNRCRDDKHPNKLPGHANERVSQRAASTASSRGAR